MSAADAFTAELIEEFRRTTRERLERITVDWVKVEKSPNDAAAFEELRRELHSLKGEAKMLGFVEVSRVAHRAEELVQHAKQQGFARAEEIGDLLLAATDALEQLAQRNPGQGADAGKLAALIARFDALTRGKSATATTPGTDSPALAASPAPVADAPAAAAEGRGADGSLRVDANLVSWLAGAAGESVIAYTRHERSLELLRTLAEDASAVVAEIEAHSPGLPLIAALKQIERQLIDTVEAHRQRIHEGALMAREIEHRMRLLRLVPIRGLFDRYVRRARDLTREQKKSVSLVVEDNGVTVDKVVVDALGEPLMHLVTNAIDHGIEAAEDRVSAGKPQEGRLELSARQGESHVTITVADDGRGVNLEAVRRRAIELGMLEADRADAATEDELLGLLYRAGFTTRQAVTEVSGRGVGLNVVKHQLAQLGGTVRIVSSPGRGTRFELTTPISVALNRVLVVTLGESSYALPATSVQGVAAIDDSALRTVDNHPCFRFRDTWVPLYDLAALVGAAVPDGPRRAVVVTHDGRTAALRVTQWRSEVEVIIKPLGPLFVDAVLVSGACVLEDGELALVLNVAEAVAGARSGGGGHRSALAGPTQATTRRRILLAEDSQITRQLVSRSLGTLGYDVAEAANGRQALSLLDAREFDLLLTDIEMPEMDGIELIRNVRQRTALRDLPIIVLSSRGSDEDKRRAAQAGADAYLVKSDFSESALRDVLGRRLGS